MHVGDGQITAGCAVVAAGVSSLAVGSCVVLAGRSERPIASRFAAAVGFVFAMQALNLPALPGISGHLLGGVLLAWWFGPVFATIGMTIVLLLQSLLLGDGGLMALGVNVLTMAVLPAAVVFPIWKRFFGRSTRSTQIVSLAAAAWASVVLAAGVCALLLETPGTLSAMLVSHAAIGVLEAAITVAAILAAEQLSPKLAPVAIALAVLAAAFGSSPWPDGLEYSVSLAGVAEAVEAAETSVLADLAMLATGTLLAAAAAFLAGVRRPLPRP
jgi:cobalt/nickel transport system permease protein